MRVTEQSLYARLLEGLARSREMSDQGLKALGDGKRVRAASDDPAGAQAALGLRARLARLAGFDRAAESARTDLSGVEAATAELVSIFSEARTLAVAGASDTASPASNAVRAEEVEQLRARVLALANLEQGGRYLFGGTATTAAPFASDGTYGGNLDEVEAPLDDTLRVGSTVSGQSVFLDGGNLFAQLDDLAAALQADDSAAVAALIPGLTSSLEHLEGVQGDVGSRLARIDAALTRHGDEAIEIARRLAEIEDVDIAEIVIQLQAADTAAAALSAGASRILGRSLFDYLG
jgi:flagellar hook-associated protein 3 FlgL